MTLNWLDGDRMEDKFIQIPEDFDFSAAVDKALKEVLTPVGRLEMLKHRPTLTGKEVEELYGISAATLRTWRSRGGGPPYYQASEKSQVLYDHKHLKDFITKNFIKVSRNPEQ